MKNNNLFLLLAVVFALMSCGTANRAAYNNGSQFRNSIYYTPDNRSHNQYAQEEQQLQNLQKETEKSIANSTQYSTYDASTKTQTIYMGDANSVDIEYNPAITYSIVDDEESYEARLRKFDSPTYTINIDFGLYDPYPWWDIHYGWSSRYWRGYYSSWYSPYWSRAYYWHRPYWDSFYWGWHNPWYAGSYWGWNSYWWDPWWGPSYVHIHRPHRPHRPGHSFGPGHISHHRPGRDVYYGKRTSSPTYNNISRPANNAGHVTGRPNTGSVTRKATDVRQINRGNANTTAGRPVYNGNSGTSSKSPAQQNGNNQYRRVKSSQSSSAATRGSSNVTTSRRENSSTGTTYRRSSSSQTRSTYSSGSSSSRSSSSMTRSSSGSSSRSSSSSSGGGSRSGSAYRR